MWKIESLVNHTDSKITFDWFFQKGSEVRLAQTVIDQTQLWTFRLKMLLSFEDELWESYIF